MSQRPRILVFTGDGKGKTTAALGMVLRAVGHGFSACVVQFIKHDTSVGEVQALALLPSVRLVQTGLGFVSAKDSPQFARHVAAAEEGLRLAARAIADPQWRIVVLDEVCNAIARELVSEDRVLELMRSAPPGKCLVLTGRHATAGLIELADTVTEMRCVKHALQVGIPAQEGVER